MMKMKTTKKRNPETWIVPLIIGAFFCFLCFCYGVGEYPDSITYMENSMDREPLYPLILKAFRGIFGNGLYLWAVIAAQNMLAFLVTWYLYAYVAERFALNRFFRAGVLAVLLMPHLLTGVLTPSGIILTNAVLSEGITLSLYQLFFTLLLKGFLEEKRWGRYMAGAWLAALAAVFARGQMMVVLPVWMVSGVVCVLRKAGTVKEEGNAERASKGGQNSAAARIGAVLVMTGAAFLIRSAGINGYNLAVFGYAQGNTGGNMTLLTNVLYSADPEDVSELGSSFSEEERALIRQIYDRMRAQEMTYADAGAGFQDRILHHEDCHDLIKFGILYEELRSQIEGELPGADEAFVRIRMDELAGRYWKAILPGCAGNFLKTYFYVVCGGLIRTVAVLNPVLNWFALLIYIVAIGLMWYLFKKDENHDGPWMMAMVLLMIAANVCATSLTIMCLSRYMIYNMSLFYIAGLVLLWRLYGYFQSHKQKK